MAGHQGPCRLMYLLDLLEKLPLSDFDASTWTPLSRSDQRSFKLICRQSSHLADQLITSTHHDLQPPPPGDDGQALRDEAGWREAIATHAAFLSRLPRLDSLTLSRWPSEAGLASEVLVCGSATQGRVTHLCLSGQPLSAHSLRAVRLAFPQLCKLSASQDLLNPLDADPPADLGVRGPAFRPPHGMPWLTKLSVSTYQDVDDEALRSLAGLAALEHLDIALFGPALELTSLRLLTGLHGLLHCAVDVSDSRCTLPDFAALLAATRLTRLELLGNWEDHLERQDAYPAAEHAAALALLGGLSHLRSLHFGLDIVVDNATFAAIGRLTQLTELYAGEISPLAVDTPPAHFPLLQQLRLAWSAPSLPPHMLQSMLPLLPLPSLTALDTRPRLLVDVSGDDDEEGPDDAAVWASTLHDALHGLAASPLLRHERGAGFTNDANSPAPRSLAQVAQRLWPTAPGLLHCVSLESFELEGAPWGVLHECWPGLGQLSLVECQVSCAGLAACVEGMITLRRLDVVDCEGMEGGDGWAVVAAHCRRPLQVAVAPHGVSEAELVRCRAVQQVLYGLQNVEWLQ